MSGIEYFPIADIARRNGIPTCQTCRWLAPECDNGGIVSGGIETWRSKMGSMFVCRRYGPTFNQKGGYAYPIGEFPRVDRTHWCGDHEPLTPLENAEVSKEANS